MSAQDEIAPPYGEEPRIRLTLADPLAPVQARHAVSLLVDASACAPASLCLPIEVIVTGPSERSFSRHVDRRIVRRKFTFTPREGGRHTIVIREVAHNRWWGTLDVDVVGDSIDDREP